MKACIVLLATLQLCVALPQIIVDYIPTSNSNRPGTSLSGTRHITVHNTANTSPGANARAHANYVKNPSTAVSWHFSVDDSEIYQHLPVNEVGWHAGTSSGNSQSVGIEICENSDGNLARATANAQELVAKLMGDLNVPLSRVVTHQFWSGKVCPNRLLSGQPMTWQAFLNGIGSPVNPDPTKCFGSVTSSTALNIRSQPNSSSVILGTLAPGSQNQLDGRVEGEAVYGNVYWFQVQGGYVSAYHIYVIPGSNHPWCTN